MHFLQCFGALRGGPGKGAASAAPGSPAGGDVWPEGSLCSARGSGGSSVSGSRPRGRTEPPAAAAAWEGWSCQALRSAPPAAAATATGGGHSASGGCRDGRAPARVGAEPREPPLSPSRGTASPVLTPNQFPGVFGVLGAPPAAAGAQRLPGWAGEGAPGRRAPASQRRVIGALCHSDAYNWRSIVSGAGCCRMMHSEFITPHCARRRPTG